MALTLTQRKKIEASVGVAVEKAIAAELSAQLGGGPTALNPATLSQLGGALTTSVRAKLAAELGIGAVANVGAGVEVSGAKSLGASVQGGSSSPKLSVAAVTGLQAGLSATLTASLEASLIGIGLSTTEREEARRTLTPRLTDALSRGVRSAVAQPTEYPSGAGAPVLDAEVTMQRVGTWHAEVTLDLDEETAPTGLLVFQIDGIEFRGTVMPSRAGAHAGKTKVKVVGGAGGLQRDLEPRNYAGGVTRVRTVVADILRDAGETLSPDSQAAVLDAQIPAWQRAKGPGSVALSKLLDRQGATWRTLRDGTVWVGVDGWPEVVPSGVVLDEDWATGSVTIAPNEPGLVPGVICRGQRVESVTHRVGRRGSTQELNANGVRSAMDAFLKRIRSETEYAYRYRCKVDRQKASGRVDVTVTDDRMKGRGVGDCNVRVGIPLATLKILPGATCLVGWEDGDPARPYVTDFDQGATATSVQVGDNARGAAFVGGTVKHIFPTIVPFTGTVAGAPAAGVLTIIEAGVGMIQDGSPALLV
jgi:hypothetical protein